MGRSILLLTLTINSLALGHVFGSTWFTHFRPKYATNNYRKCQPGSGPGSPRYQLFGSLGSYLSFRISRAAEADKNGRLVTLWWQCRIYFFFYPTQFIFPVPDRQREREREWKYASKIMSVHFCPSWLELFPSFFLPLYLSTLLFLLSQPLPFSPAPHPPLSPILCPVKCL